MGKPSWQHTVHASKDWLGNLVIPGEEDNMDKTILVVEDEMAIADILLFNLQREGYRTLVANDGPEGLRLALTGAPDLVLLDVMLVKNPGDG